MSIRLSTYDHDLDAVPRRSIFLAGATAKDAEDLDRKHAATFDDVWLTRWRVEYLRALRALGVSVRAIVPEFADGDFATRAQERWGATPVPAGVPCRPQSWGVLAWEKRGLSAAGVVVAWMGCRNEPPLSGRNARPEIQGLIERHALGASWPRRLVLGVAPDATATTRYYALAQEAGLLVARSLDELAVMTRDALDDLDVSAQLAEVAARRGSSDLGVPEALIAEADHRYRAIVMPAQPRSIVDLWRRLRGVVDCRPAEVALAHALRDWAAGQP